MTFGQEALQSFVVLIERLLTNCSATQVVVAANAADWMPFIQGANLPLAYNDRFHRAQILRGMHEPEARELRDLRVGVDHIAPARKKIPDSLIRSQLSIGPDGRPRRLITPRKFLSEWAQRWEANADADISTVPDSNTPVPASLDPELEKARAVARREPIGFFPESIRTVLMEVLGAERKTVDRYEFLLLDDIAIFLEPAANNRRWEAWAQRAEKLPVDGIRALRPARDLSELEGSAHAPVPAATWKFTRTLHRLLETKLKIIQVGAGQMFELIAAGRLMDGAADLGRTRGEVAEWLRKTHGDTWRDFLSAPAASGRPAGAIDGGAQSPVSDRSGIVMFSVTRLLDLLTRPDGTLTPAMSLPFRERGLLFHELACRFVRHLLEHAAVTTSLNDTLVAFLNGERLWREAHPYDAEPPRIQDALQQLATGISRLRDSAAGLRSWQELYISTELQVNDVLGVYDGVTVILTGRCDVLRRRIVGGPPEVVDYQLSSTGSHAVEKQLQLALYARLLSQGANPLLCDGALEIYSPTLREMRFTHAELLRFFEHEIEPALRKMVREARSQTSSLRQICIDTLNSPASDKTPSPGFPALPRNEGTAAIESAFQGFIGNAEVVSRIKTALADAASRSKPPILPSNILLTGPGGLGKTELAKRIAKALGLPLVQVPGSRIAKVDDLLALVDSELETRGLAAREEGTDSGLPRMVYPPLVIFVDEVHELRRRADRFLNLFEPGERRAVGSRHVGDFRSSTLIAATTDAGLLPKPFLTRFHPYELRAYTAQEVAEILRLSGVPGDNQLLEMLAIIGRLNPRIAKLRAEEFMSHHRVHGFPLDLSGLERLCGLLGIDRLGLTARDRRYLELLDKGSAGVDVLAHALQVGKEEIMRDIEPYLVQSGFMTTGRNGRKITETGIRLLRGN